MIEYMKDMDNMHKVGGGAKILSIRIAQEDAYYLCCEAGCEQEEVLDQHHAHQSLRSEHLPNILLPAGYAGSHQ